MKPERPLTFDWHAHDRSFLRMGLSMLLTLVAIVGMFIVFRVVTPESRPVDVRPQRVLLLNPNVPAERALIHQAMDRSFGMLPSEPAVTEPPAGLTLPEFTPSYAGYELRLKPLPAGLNASRQARLFAQEMDILPPLPAPKLKRPPPAPPQVLRAAVEGPAAGRARSSLVIPEVPLADVTRPRFQVAVGPRGRVMMALPLSSSDDADINQKLHHFIMQMRFAPAESEVEWAQVSFKWSRREEGGSR
ncbi:hypothetical protein WJU23_06990 [Prosthecobacter sp. SYSU 5D2]|uniref:hypothetical protein n=1 Tax=Prosthecobacter sp. SYSU 5D2 TaxID=3134134 RepID=UPI0031FEB44A